MEERIKECIAKYLMEICHLNNDEIEFEFTFNNLGVDSLELTEVIMNVEKELGIEIPDDIISSFNTINDAIPVIIELINNKNGK
ncbi:MAG: acyl carrier protein [Flavobacteriaceae bacterium]